MTQSKEASRLIVSFNDPGEFLDELRKDHDRVVRRILRLTVRRRYAQPFVHVAVVGTAAMGDTVVRLDHRVGEALFGNEQADIVNKTKAVLDKLTEEAKKIGLEVRAGVYE